MKTSPYTSYLELQPNALLVQQNFYYLQKVGVTQPIPSADQVTKSASRPSSGF
jgi:hypothetical protein